MYHNAIDRLRLSLGQFRDGGGVGAIPSGAAAITAGSSLPFAPAVPHAAR